MENLLIVQCDLYSKYPPISVCMYYPIHLSVPLQVYAVAMKSIRYAAKNVQEMSRELAAIAAVTTATAELAEKLHEAEQMKAETEAKLNERVRGRSYRTSLLGGREGGVAQKQT